MPLKKIPLTSKRLSEAFTQASNKALADKYSAQTSITKDPAHGIPLSDFMNAQVIFSPFFITLLLLIKFNFL